MKNYRQSKFPLYWLLNGLVPDYRIGKYAPNRKRSKKFRRGRL